MSRPGMAALFVGLVLALAPAGLDAIWRFSSRGSNE
jgi:hypothetical protein